MTAAHTGVRWRLVGVGLLLLQLGWLVALPPFAGMDEWDHAYRAAAVVHGQWSASPSEATRGTGAFVRVPTHLVEAARAECERLNYGGKNECVGTPDGDFTVVASGAGRYNPTYYALIGMPSRFLEGQAALYGMRVMSLLLCWVLVLASLWSLSRWAGPLAAFVVVACLTPTVLYATAIVAPNGLEMVSGLALWCALAAIAHDREDRAFDARTIVLAVVACSLLLSVRSLGPLWAALAVGVALLAWPSLLRRLLGLATSFRGGIAIAWLGCVSLASIWWIQSQDALVVGRSEEGTLGIGERFATALTQTVVWTFQLMGAFPYRNNPAPAVVYACLLPVLLVLAVWALYCSTARERLAQTLSLVVAYSLPFAITVATVERYGAAWQGRYALPFLVGVFVIGSIALARSIERPRPTLLYVAVAMLATSHVVSTVWVLWIEHRLLTRSSTRLWPLDVPPAALSVFVLIGYGAFSVPLVVSALRRAR